LEIEIAAVQQLRERQLHFANRKLNQRPTQNRCPLLSSRTHLTKTQHTTHKSMEEDARSTMDSKRAVRSVTAVWRDLSAGGANNKDFEKIWSGLHNDGVRSKSRVKPPARDSISLPATLHAAPDAHKTTEQPSEISYGSIDAPSTDRPPLTAAGGGTAAIDERCTQQLLDPDLQIRRAALERIHQVIGAVLFVWLCVVHLERSSQAPCSVRTCSTLTVPCPTLC